MVLAVAFVLLSIVVPRPYCRFVCPTGTLMKTAEMSK
jgi:polyferredoxin